MIGLAHLINRRRRMSKIRGHFFIHNHPAMIVDVINKTLGGFLL
jgi:hypothetical protein